jgi:hypothetical protein
MKCSAKSPNVLNALTFMLYNKAMPSCISTIEDRSKGVSWLIEVTSDSSACFYGPITQSKLKTFEDLTRKTKLKCRSGKVLHVHISPELVLRRVLVLATCRVCNKATPSCISTIEERSKGVSWLIEVTSDSRAWHKSALFVLRIVPSSWKRDEGMKMLQSFVNGRLTEGSDRDFYGPITGSKLKTFEDLTPWPLWGWIVIELP